MDLNINHIKKQIKITKDSDLYINIFLTKSCEVFEYVDIKKDEKIYLIDRQLINPYYINFGFFGSVKRIKVNNSSELTPAMKNYLQSAYTESIEGAKYEGDIDKWFSDIGYNLLIDNTTTIIDEATGKKIRTNEIDKLEEIEKDNNSIISKAYFFPISVNK